MFASACALADSACAATVLVADGLALSGTTAVAVPAHGETVTSCSTLAVRDCASVMTVIEAAKKAGLDPDRVLRTFGFDD